MSSFARKQLEKFGWTDGSGLGKDGKGINTFLKVERRAAGLMSGIGHSASSGTTNDDMGLGSVLKNMGPKKEKNKKRDREGSHSSDSDAEEVSVKKVSASKTALSSPGLAAKKHVAEKEVKLKKLNLNEEADEAEAEVVVPSKKESKRQPVAEASSSTSDSDSDSSDSSSEDEGDIMKWDDKKLFEKCGGVRLSSRTGRHRVFKGKLARIEESAKEKADEKSSKKK